MVLIPCFPEKLGCLMPGKIQGQDLEQPGIWDGINFILNHSRNFIKHRETRRGKFKSNAGVFQEIHFLREFGILGITSSLNIPSKVPSLIQTLHSQNSGQHLQVPEFHFQAVIIFWEAQHFSNRNFQPGMRSGNLWTR